METCITYVPISRGRQSRRATHMCNSSANVEKEGGIKPNFLTGVTCFFISPVASQKLDYIFFPLMHTKEIPMMQLLLLTLTEERFFHRHITQPGDYKTPWQHFSNPNIPVTKNILCYWFLPHWQLKIMMFPETGVGREIWNIFYIKKSHLQGTCN